MGEQRVSYEWQASELEFGDAASVYAVGKEKSRIEKWRQACKL